MCTRCVLSMRWLLAIVIASVSASSVHPSERQGPAKRPNILLLLSDDQRPDAIGALGNELINTPNLDELARSGTVFTRATCANPICTPSRAEIISGCTSFRNGVLDFGRQIKPELALWPQTMLDAGYHTWFVGKWHNRGKPSVHGFEDTLGLFGGGGGQWWKDQVDWKGSSITGYRGWIFQTEDGKKFPEKGVGLTADISAEFANAAIEFIERKTEKPWFLQVSFTAPHDPLIMPTGFESMYEAAAMTLPKNFLSEHPFDHGNFDGRDEKLLPWPRKPELVREVIAMYYAVISHMDQQIGRIIQLLRDTNQIGNTIIIFSSDHGLGVGSHGLRGKQSMYEHTVGVPLIFHGPGIPKGAQRDAQCYLRDLFPTTCELAGIKIPKTVEGRSLASVLAGKEKSVYDEIYGYFRDKQRMIRSDRWKLVHYPHLDKYQLFDLANDPDELKNVVEEAEFQAVATDLKARLRRWQTKVGDPVLIEAKD